MNIKSLILGSAAAFAVVSGAQAADAIVAAAPEPMEYVKVCDAFGTGYFYIPGTETCLKISGLVRAQLNYSNAPLIGFASPVNPGYKWSSYTGSQFRLNVEAKNDSEVGTVYSFIQVRGYNGQEAGTGVNTGTTYNGGYRAYFYAGIDAGAYGFEAGTYDSYWTRFFGYGGYTDDGGSYQYADNSYASFFGKVGNIAYTIGVDDLTRYAGDTAGINAAVKGTFDNVSAALGADYDIASKAFGMKGYVEGKFDPISLKVMGIYSAKDNNFYAPARGFTLIVGGKVQATKQLFAAVDYSYSFTPKTWNVVGDLGWNVANGFAVLVEGKYTSTKVTSGFLRFQRNF
ncbi:porin [Rhizobium sp. C1]|uniref:porin n=1 Tax=Rhizobium sp. C1 TaxID=1349799 RepID=UPI001E285D7C|nr:porin [Rhizobium sp. C1]MCD2177542.1 porin [Rhizobium sp. C1]